MLPRLGRWTLVGALVLSALLVALGYRNATADPIVRRLSVTAADYPAGTPTVRVVLFSDLHAHWPETPPSRVKRVVDEINRLRPDVVLAAGDFVGDSKLGSPIPAAQALAPLGGLKARLGVYAVLGNKDYRLGANKVAAALQRAGVHLLVNEAVQVGPLAIGGIDGRLLRRPRVWAHRRQDVLALLRSVPGPKLLLVHRPDDFKWTPGWLTLVVAGHTHCGQIVLPLVGALATGSTFGRKYLCGAIRDGSRSMLVTGGIGTSVLPLRIGAPPDIWLIQIGRGTAGQGK